MSTVVFSASADGLEFITINQDGTVTTRHRRADGVVHWHRQRHDVFPEILRLRGPMECWRAEILPLPPDACTPGSPEKIVVLLRTDCERLIPFAFPFAALSDEAVLRILQAAPEILLLVHDSEVSCLKFHYDAFHDGKELEN
jgi:hypothetical protein